jgi:hypothetical protein
MDYQAMQNTQVKDNWQHVKMHGSGIYYVTHNGSLWHENVVKKHNMIPAFYFRFKIRITSKTLQ